MGRIAQCLLVLSFVGALAAAMEGALGLVFIFLCLAGWSWGEVRMARRDPRLLLGEQMPEGEERG